MQHTTSDAILKVQGLVYASCLALNAQDWKAFLELCSPGSFRYRIVNYSPEIRREQCWMDKDRNGLKTLFDLLPKHNSDHSPLTRHSTVYKVEYEEGAEHATAVTLVSVYKTQLDGAGSHFESGRTSLFAVGKYEDQISMLGVLPALTARTVRLDTRQIDIGSHLPL